MIANAAFAAAMVLLLLAFSLLGPLEFLAPYKRLIATQYLWVIIGALVIVFLALQWGWLLICWGVDGLDWTPP